MAGVLITSIVSGQLISKLGRYRFFPITGTAVMTVGMLLLSTLHAGTSTWVAAGYACVLGLGLGMVMQVLVLAVQNAVDMSVMGVATSGSTLFRQVGGSIGVALFGTIFANRVRVELAHRLPAGTHIPKTINPAGIQPPAPGGARRLRRRVRGRAAPGLPDGRRHLGARLRAHLAPARGAAAQAGRPARRCRVGRGRLTPPRVVARPGRL